VTLSNEVECDEASVVAGHKGQPEVVKSTGRRGRRRRRKGTSGRGTLEKEKPPVFGMIERGGQVVIHLLANVQQKTIEPFIKDTIAPSTLVYTDEYSMYAPLETWGSVPVTGEAPRKYRKSKPVFAPITRYRDTTHF
jgi:transposase-like protein